MPIYAYRCETCGLAKDVLQKISDPVLSTCPACGAETFRKQLTAAGFQLKGSGWYVTDFRGGDTARKPGQVDAEPASGAAEKSDSGDKADKAVSSDAAGGTAGKSVDSSEKTAGAAAAKTAVAAAPSSGAGDTSSAPNKPPASQSPAKS